MNRRLSIGTAGITLLILGYILIRSMKLIKDEGEVEQVRERGRQIGLREAEESERESVRRHFS